MVFILPEKIKKSNKKIQDAETPIVAPKSGKLRMFNPIFLKVEEIHKIMPQAEG